ncbi:conjugated polyketone reductase C1 [Fistulina hepatica ATCC 64428]|uniref:Conjugated polyketone reductase C1 n=1 Tax=Fistulina hepatica ATCC 64428 TaxID=1128425 RepID=A0A0D7ADS2_9AGAR|nr:conjugated polyketone reductase C1 [Fistulina hepatica ATCC 64428]
MYSVPTIALSTGTKVPWLGWGNGSGNARKTAFESGKIALASGFQHIDTAQGYGNEVETGNTIRVSGIPKDNIFVTSKLSPIDNTKPVALPEVRGAVEESIKKLGFTPDLFLIHNPFVAESPADLKKMWQILEDLKAEGVLKDIGVSNFRPQDLEVILDGARYVPTVNQLEYHPYVLVHLEPVLAIHKKHGIVTSSFGPLTPLLRHPGGPLKPVLKRIAARIAADHPKLSINEVTVLLLWTRAQGVITITASGNAEHIKRLADVAPLPDLLTPAEVEEITNVGKTVHFRHYREHMEIDFPLPALPDGK